MRDESMTIFRAVHLREFRLNLWFPPWFSIKLSSNYFYPDYKYFVSPMYSGAIYCCYYIVITMSNSILYYRNSIINEACYYVISSYCTISHYYIAQYTWSVFPLNVNI